MAWIYSVRDSCILRVIVEGAGYILWSMHTDSVDFTEEEKLALANIKVFVAQMLNVTARLVRIDENRKPVGVASGFVIERAGRWYVLAAQHSLSKRRYCLETNISRGSESLLLTFDSYRFYRRFDLRTDPALPPAISEKEIDFAWMEIDREKIKQRMAADPRLHGASIEVPLYAGPLDRRPAKGEFYGYAAWNRAKPVKSFQTYLRRDYSYAVDLQFEGLDHQKGLYRFRPMEEPKTDEYYRGASGAPIADLTGVIVSMLIGGDTEAGVLWGLPLADVEPLIGLEAAADLPAFQKLDSAPAS